jgi:peptidyl-prolyl cis-trans isomerase B (cyclophilin B)
VIGRSDPARTIPAMRTPLTLVPVVLAVAALSLTACSGDDDSEAIDPGSSEGSTTTCDYPADAAGAAKEVEPPATKAPAAGDVALTIGTTVGDLKATLGRDRTPCTVNSFLSLADQGYFDDTKCHRMTTAGIFVLQCGDPSGTGAGGPGYSFKDELDGTETYEAGTLAMANAGPDTNGSQFFIVYADSSLPPAYTVFGHVDDAAVKTVEDVAKKGVTGGQGDGAPKEDVTISSVTVD